MCQDAGDAEILGVQLDDPGVNREHQTIGWRGTLGVIGIACRRRGGAALAAAARAPQPAPPHPALPERQRRPLMIDPWVHRPQAIVASMLGVSRVVGSSLRCCYGL